MKNALERIDPDDQLQKWNDVAEWMALVESGLSEDDHEDEPTVSAIARKFELTKREALQLVCNPKFAEHYHSMRKAIAKVEFDRDAWTRLQRIVKTGSDRDAINAVKEAAALLGYKDTTPLVGRVLTKC